MLLNKPEKTSSLGVGKPDRITGLQFLSEGLIGKYQKP